MKQTLTDNMEHATTTIFNAISPTNAVLASLLGIVLAVLFRQMEVTLETEKQLETVIEQQKTAPCTIQRTLTIDPIVTPLP